MKTVVSILVSIYPAIALAQGSGTGLTLQFFDDRLTGTHLSGAPFHTQLDPILSHDFQRSPPVGLKRTTEFSARWTGQLQSRFSGQYLLTAVSDNGVRVKINGKTVIDNWTNHSVRPDFGYFQFDASRLYQIEIQYYQGVGGSILQLWWESAQQAKEIIPTAQLYASISSAAATYFVSPLGNDNATGLSAAQAWKTLQRVNQTSFLPGENILLERGGSYAGTLQPLGSGSPGLPITIGAYGVGAAPIIDAGKRESAVQLFNQEYWKIDSLNITNAQRFGIFVSGDLSNKVLHGITLTNLTVHDVYGTPRWDSGLVMISPIGDRLTFDGVVIDGVTAYSTNAWYGIHVGFNLYYSYPTQPPRTTDVTIRKSKVHHVNGDGITVAQAQKVLIEHNVVFETGLAPAGISYTPNGIWSWQCDQTVIQYNEGYATHSFGVDGGVFDVDWGSTNTTIQYNYAHDAQGYCIAIMGGHGVTTSNTIVRFNVCSNNGRGAKYARTQGDIYIITFGGGTIDGLQIHNNSAYWNPVVDAPWIKGRSIAFTGTSPKFIMNNVVYSRSATLLDLDNSVPMDRNLYWVATGATPIWKYGSTTATSMADFKRLTKQEWNGQFTDPLLNNPTYASVGRPSLPFTLDSNSPAIRTGAPWAGMGNTDFFGKPLPSSGSSDVGASHSGY